MKVALLFPGQGAQRVGMGQELAARFPSARRVFDEADRALGYPLSALCWKGPADELRKSMHTQPALLTHSLAAWRVLEAAGVRPAWVAGHSLGEYSACVAAGVMSFEDGVQLVRRRGELMFQAGIDRPGTMAAILGLDAATVDAVCAEAADAGIVRSANLNAPGQVVISGEIPAVERACELAKARGAKRAIRLEVSGAFHSPLMAGAAEGLAQALDEVSMRAPSCPVVCNVTARPVQKTEDLRAALKAQLLGAVRWEDSMRWLHERGATFVEVGTGAVLKGLLRTIAPEATALNADTPESVEATLAGLGLGAESRAPSVVERPGGGS